MIALTVPETRRLVLALGAPDAQRAFRLGWSRWRRAHQAVATRCHAARHARGRRQRTTDRMIVPDALAQGARTGRPRHDHRTVLSRILAVVGTDLSWREIPAAYGKWETAYKRYRLCCKEGRWPRIVVALGREASEMTL